MQQHKSSFCGPLILLGGIAIAVGWLVAMSMTVQAAEEKPAAAITATAPDWT